MQVIFPLKVAFDKQRNGICQQDKSMEHYVY